MAPPAPANVRVLVRVRPLNESERTERGIIGRTNILNIDTSAGNNIDFHGENDKENGAVISVNNFNDLNRRITSGDLRAGYTSDGDMNGAITKQYMFDAVHGERSTQSEVYDSIKGIVDAVVDGYNGTIVAYGQTGSGKTYTVFGSDNQQDEVGAGLVHRSLRDIFNKVALERAKELSNENDEQYPMTNRKTSFKGSFFEIFNERVFDLLAPESLEKSLAVREDKNGVYVESLNEVEVRNTQDAEDLLAKGLANRHVASTNMNRTSSRSHAVFVLSVKTEHTTSDGLRKVRSSKFTLVDLAGSERQRSTAAIGNRLKEASMINKSLLCLGHVINALVDREHGRERHVPFRNSKLTFLLKDTWGGNSKTCLVATVSPSAVSQGETISTLTFAQRAKLIKNNAILNEDTCGTVAALQAEVAKLKSKLEHSSYIDRDKYLFDNLDGNENEVIASLKRLNKRAESRIAELEKMISDENEKNNTLKRKLQEETMARKFKERRLDHILRKNPDEEDDNQVAILKNEISSLQRRLQAPSEDAIEWRVAYEETKEALDKMMEGESNIVELEEKNAELEETVDRLCAEKLDLEDRVKELTESSSETRKEIESIMNEVDKLERDMVCCQERLQQREKDCKDFESRAVSAELRLQDVLATSDEDAAEKEVLRKQNSELQKSLNEKSDMLSELMKEVDQKSAEIRELELLVQENEKELQLTIERLQNEQDNSITALSTKERYIDELKASLESKSEENLNLSVELKSALSEVKKQREAIVELEQKINFVTEEKDDAISMIHKDLSQKESDLQEKIESMQRKIVDLSLEKDNLEARLSCAKEQADLSLEKFGNYDKVIKEYEDELSRISEEYRGAEERLKTELSVLEKNFIKAESRIGVLSSKLSQAEASRIALARESDEEKLQMAHNLGNEIDGLRAMLHRSAIEQEELQTKLMSSEEQSLQLQESIASLMRSIAAKDDEIQAIAQQNKHVSERNATSVQELQHQLQSQISILETDRDYLKQELNVINEELRSMEKENVDLNALLKDSQVKVSSLKAELDAAEKEKSNLLSLHEHEQDVLTEQLAYYSKMDIERREMIQVKESEISDIKDQYSTLQGRLNDANIINQLSLEEQHSLKRLYDESKDMLRVEKDIAEKAKMQYESKIIEYEEEISNLKELCEKYCEELYELRDRYANMEGETNKKISSLDEAMSHLDEKYAAQIREKDVELGEMELKLKSLECDCSALRNQNKAIVSSEVELQDKYNRLKDRYVLLDREKGNLEFEIDTMQADHDALGDQVRVLTEKTKELEEDNRRLKTFINTMKSSDSQSGTSDMMSSSGTTWNSDSRLSYDTLATNMDSVIDKMSSTNPKFVAAPDTIQEEHNEEDRIQEEQDDACVEDNPDDSFDESLFLPNSEDQHQARVELGKSSASKETDANRNELLVYQEDKENTGIKTCVTFCTTPCKAKDDYGNRRVPLSDRKNKTPLTNQSKRLRSSTKKVMSSSKKSRTNYLLIDNKQLFK